MNVQFSFAVVRFVLTKSQKVIHFSLMVIQDFLDYINKFNFVHSCGVFDIFDRCIYILTFSIILICSATITIKSYVLEPMSCYVPTSIGGSNVLPYVNNYCWIIGTIAKGVHEHNNDDDNYWKSLEVRKINYYQWVPFILGLQAALLYIPYVFWECMIYNRLGTNLQFIIDIAKKSVMDFGIGRQKKISQMASLIFVLIASRKRKYSKPNSYFSKLPFYKMEIVFYYLLLKLTSIIVITSQFLIMEKVLNMNGKYRFFGVTLLQDLLNGQHWEKTNLFPRMAFCRVPFKVPNTAPVNIQAQCSLSVNILNEKIFIFLWWWFALVTILQTIGLILWMYRCLLSRNRIKFIEHSVLVNKSFSGYSFNLIKDFDQNFFSFDGSFLIHMTRLNCGDLVSNDLVQELLNMYNSSYATKARSSDEELSQNSNDNEKDFDKKYSQI